MTPKKSLMGILLVASATGGPYVLFETDAGSEITSSASSLFSDESQPSPGWLAGTGADPQTATESGFWNALGFESSASSQAEGRQLDAPQVRVHALQQVLRFDISPNWVIQKFPQVMTVLSDLQLDGLRVPLVTGTAPTDMAGTLSYFFDSYQRVQRIQIHAVTGDPSRFVAELQHAYQLQQQPALGGQLYVRKWNGRPTSLLYITPAAVIREDAPYARYNVLIEVNQAGLEYGVSQQAEQLLEAGRQANRWQ